jgi:hypothetical protein
VTRPRTLKASVLVAAGALAMSACSVHPGAAAVIGSESIGDGDLDHVATALCAAQSTGQQAQPVQTQELSSRAARLGALDVLINGALSRQYGAAHGVEPNQGQVSAALDSNARTIAALPASSRAAFRSTLQQYAEGQLVLIAAGRRSLAQQGKRHITEQQAVAEGRRLRDAWAAKHVEVTVDPRYGTFSQGALHSGDGSLSAPVSSKAVDGAKPQPSSTWVSSLPASQKCS